MLRRIAQITFYLLLQLSGEEFEGIVVDPQVLPQYAAQQIGDEVSATRCSQRVS